MDILKSKLDFKSGKQLLIIVASLVAALVTIYVAYTSIARRNISLSNPDSDIGAANPSCLLNLSLNKPSPSPTPIACVDDTDIALVIDRSSTMTDKEADGRQKLAWAKEAAVAFVDAVAASGKTNIRISVSSFGSQGNSGTRADGVDYDSSLDINLTNNYAAVKSAINGIVYKHSGTCIQCGLRIGNGSLLTPATTHPKFTILLSDGMANHIWDGTTSNSTALAIAEANTGRSGGIIYYAIGYGTGSQISPSTLISIAGTSANYVYKPNVTDWAGAFVSLLSNICTVPGSSPTPTVKPTATKSPSPKPATSTPVAKTPTPKPTKSPSPKPRATKSPSPKPTASPISCTNCQYQIDLFVGPVIQSFAGGVRYSSPAPNRLLGSRTNYSLTACKLVTAVPLPKPALTLSSSCTNITANIVPVIGTSYFDTTNINTPKGYVKADFKNVSTGCTYNVGLASYKASGTNIDTQNLNDYKNTTLSPGQTASLIVKMPMLVDSPSCYAIPTSGIGGAVAN